LSIDDSFLILSIRCKDKSSLHVVWGCPLLSCDYGIHWFS